MPATPARAEIVRDFAKSELFERTFQDGMELVEDAATYLDGSGRQESKLLSRNAALVYAGESMRMTTRLMKLASWLLVQRAVREGDMSALDACDPRYRLGEDEVRISEDRPPAHHDPLLMELPTGILDLAVSRLHQAAEASLVMDNLKKEILYELGDTLMQMGKKEEGIEQFKLLYDSDVGYRDVGKKVEDYYREQAKTG